MFLLRSSSAVLSLTSACAFLATGASAADCVGSETSICMSVDIFAGETGYYNLDRGDFETLTGSSPTITAKIGQKLTFDQTDRSNWYHAVGFAYAPDGAHGADWGADAEEEVEGAGELQYLIDGQIPDCEEAGATGLDCYEPEFFYPAADWRAKDYSAELTITPEVAAKSNGGVIYYFCHIHSKMSGKIIIQKEDGTAYTNENAELALYTPTANDAFDTNCGTSHTSEYADGATNECKIDFFAGTKDTEFEKCLHAVDCQMNYEMYSETTPDETDKKTLFMQQMIPHHANAVNMAKLLLKQGSADVDEELEDILHDIVNTQNFQIHQFRNYLNGKGKLLHDTTVVPHIHAADNDHAADDTTSAGAGFFMNAFVTMFSGAVVMAMMM